MRLFPQPASFAWRAGRAWRRLCRAERLLVTVFALILMQGCASSPAPLLEPIIPPLAEVPASARPIGVFGVISDIERPTVNGMRLGVDADVVQPTAPIIGHDLPLAVGSTVFAEAYQVTNGFRARRLEPFFPIVGVVDRVQRQNGLLDIMGTTVRASEDTKVADHRAGRSRRPLALADIATAHRVAVSGVWQGDDIIASRIDILERTGPVFIGGLLRPGEKRIKVAGTLLDYACCRHLSAAVFARVGGRYQDDFLAVTSLRTGKGLLFSDEVDRLVIEATPVRQPGSNGVHFSGFDIEVNPSSPADIETGAPALFLGEYDQSFSIEQQIALPADETVLARALRSFFP